MRVSGSPFLPRNYGENLDAGHVKGAVHVNIIPEAKRQERIRSDLDDFVVLP